MVDVRIELLENNEPVIYADNSEGPPPRERHIFMMRSGKDPWDQAGRALSIMFNTHYAAIKVARRPRCPGDNHVWLTEQNGLTDICVNCGDVRA